MAYKAILKFYKATVAFWSNSVVYIGMPYKSLDCTSFIKPSRPPQY